MGGKAWTVMWFLFVVMLFIMGSGSTDGYGNEGDPLIGLAVVAIGFYGIYSTCKT